MTIEDEEDYGGSIFQMKLQPVVVHEGHQEDACIKKF